MSISAGLHVRLTGDGFAATSIIRSLLEAGWSMDDHGTINILPFGDDDSYDWTGYLLSAEDEVWQVFSRKQSAREKIGVTMLFGDSGVGGELLIDPAGTLTFSATVARRKGEGWSDVTWYLERILPALSRVAKVVSWEWDESS
jgi:hypothetical protein